jgi:hypothetical protein
MLADLTQLVASSFQFTVTIIKYQELGYLRQWSDSLRAYDYGSIPDKGWIFSSLQETEGPFPVAKWPEHKGHRVHLNRWKLTSIVNSAAQEDFNVTFCYQEAKVSVLFWVFLKWTVLK